MTQDDVRSIFHYKDGNLIWANDTKPRMKSGEIAGYLHVTGYVVIGINGRKYKAHRLIFLYHHGYVPKQIDHINRKKNDNRIENLRATNSSFNQMNTDNRRGKQRGVYKRLNGRWRAQIYKNNKAISLGHYATQEDAQNAYQKAKNEIYGAHL